MHRSCSSAGPAPSSIRPGSSRSRPVADTASSILRSSSVQKKKKHWQADNAEHRHELLRPIVVGLLRRRNAVQTVASADEHALLRRLHLERARGHCPEPHSTLMSYLRTTSAHLLRSRFVRSTTSCGELLASSIAIALKRAFM